MGITAQFKSDIDNVFNLLLKEIDRQKALAVLVRKPLSWHAFRMKKTGRTERATFARLLAMSYSWTANSTL